MCLSQPDAIVVNGQIVMDDGYEDLHPPMGQAVVRRFEGLYTNCVGVAEPVREKFRPVTIQRLLTSSAR
ncbi:MAG: hypothetical protein HZB34_11345 [Nitrospirae bacterium]|nr:hypothetical protein [Nitrospirota bacterium]